MSIQIKLFGPLTDVVGSSQLTLSEIADTESLRKTILAEFPGLNKHAYKIAVGKKIVNENIKLNPGDEVALLPPFAGG
ncbi:MAG: MoaD/ThiS family protein [Phycisphaeraceae bacterium]|nr:MoaD/ThiS family protein [Phycisphaeraceae bacterium]